MATNRRDHTKDASGDGERYDKKGRTSEIASVPEIVSVSVEPSSSFAPSPKAAQGDIWASLLESSPWSANHGGRVEAAPQVSAPTRPPESAPVGDLVSRWSQPIWRNPTHDEGAVELEESVVVDGGALSPVVPEDDAVLSVSEVVIEVQPELSVQALGEEELEAAIGEPGGEASISTSLARLVELAEGIIYPDIHPTDTHSADELIEVPENFTVVGAADAPMEIEDEAPPVEVTEELVVDVVPVKIEVEDVPVEVIAELVVDVEPVAFEVEDAPVEVMEELVVDVEPVAFEVEDAPVEAMAESVVDVEPVTESIPADAVVEPEAFDSVHFESSRIETGEASDWDSTSAPAAPLLAPEPTGGQGLAELIEEAAAIASVAAPAAPAPRPIRTVKTVAVPVQRGGAVQEVPVEDLLGGIFGVAGSMVRGVFNAGSGLVDGVVKGGRFIGSNVVASTRRLTETIEGSCGSCSTPQCDTDGTKKNRQP